MVAIVMAMARMALSPFARPQTIPRPMSRWQGRWPCFGEPAGKRKCRLNIKSMYGGYAAPVTSRGAAMLPWPWGRPPGYGDRPQGGAYELWLRTPTDRAAFVRSAGAAGD